MLESGLARSILPPGDAPDRGHFLTFRRPEAADLYRRAHERGVITDYRGDRWRVGLGIYHDQDDVERLADVVNSIL